MHERGASKPYKFRVFICYAHEDVKHAEQVRDVLRDNLNLDPIWDKDFAPGAPFTESIKSGIRHSHIFMPLLTETSRKRAWVHQEIGYAMALDLGILPIAFGRLPGQMAAQLQAICVNDVSELPAKLEKFDFERLVFPPASLPQNQMDVAEWPEKRTETLVRSASRMIDLHGFGELRQRGAFGSFSIPDSDITLKVWQRRDGHHTRSQYQRHLLREERRVLERHLRECGGRLLIYPRIPAKKVGGPAASRQRIETLLEFFETVKSNPNVSVAITKLALGGNLTIVGDWFAAESRQPRPIQGYHDTVFTWHAPDVLRTARQFDREYLEIQNDGESIVGTDNVITELRLILSQAAVKVGA